MHLVHLFGGIKELDEGVRQVLGNETRGICVERANLINLEDGCGEKEASYFLRSLGVPKLRGPSYWTSRKQHRNGVRVAPEKCFVDALGLPIGMVDPMFDDTMEFDMSQELSQLTQLSQETFVLEDEESKPSADPLAFTEAETRANNKAPNTSYNECLGLYRSITKHAATEGEQRYLARQLHAIEKEILKNKLRRAKKQLGTSNECGVLSMPEVDNRKVDTRLRKASSPPPKKKNRK